MKHEIGMMTIYEGDARESLLAMPAQSVHVSVSSPPYWGLRSYLPADHKLKPLELGSEPTPELYVENLVGVYRAVHRVLRDDGVLWVNLGDTYIDDSKWGGKTGNKHAKDLHGNTGIGRSRKASGVPAGNLAMIPHRFALAMQLDGWILRDTVIWAKRSPMPQSVRGWSWEQCRVKVAPAKKAAFIREIEEHDDPRKLAGPNGLGDSSTNAQWEPCPGCDKCNDNGGLVLRRGSWRHTSSFEYVFMFVKTGSYFCDGDAAQEAAKHAGRTMKTGDNWNTGMGAHHGKFHRDGREKGKNNGAIIETRNPRNVWTLSSEPSKLKHFAKFPREIPRRCLRSAPAKVCSRCGAPFAPVVERTRVATRPGTAPKEGGAEANRDPLRHVSSSTVSEYRPTCLCGAEPGPAVVLDPFVGTGTTLDVAIAAGHKAIGCELNPDYIDIIRRKQEPAPC